MVLLEAQSGAAEPPEAQPQAWQQRGVGPAAAQAAQLPPSAG